MRTTGAERIKLYNVNPYKEAALPRLIKDFEEARALLQQCINEGRIVAGSDPDSDVVILDGIWTTKISRFLKEPQNAR